MTQEELNRLESDLASGKTTAKEVIALLVKNGYSREDAQESVFIALGGDDIVETGENGVQYYRISGMPVDEVTVKMEQ